ncbi:NERD domain-containing protein [Janthinobacterium agaricidamnosum]|uniref:Nuclease-related domain protein n=1 Tax=Janthinobacterium agaricidamnosum NBRC 102515 = DSM 9628 TaxID=1349767 RepID=W0V5C0_9BURK|nr:AAA family ATPase [Janthinobacterium agaricidamnosum]CDG84019.1 nuclease-related domain protein [Janthinobacterium agaricidamnosum NBRC 102515 = DSM 9628]
MARMIPVAGPQDTNSRGEKKIYDMLKQGLSDDFTVIHSLPWLARGVKEIDPNYAPTGEIDFLVIHESLGLLALEVKGGKQSVKDGLFIYVKTGNTGNHVLQTRNNLHGLARWLGNDPRLRWRIGYGLVFPDSVFGENIISPGLVDVTVTPPQSLFIDRMSMDAPELAARIRELMAYWKQTLGNPTLGSSRAARLVQVLCPTFDGTPSWGNRVEYDNRVWLRLTQEQASVVNTLMSQARMVVTGWPGTGKTLIAVEIARRMIAEGKRVLMLTFNALLVEHLRREIAYATMARVATWHGFCSEYARRLPGQFESNSTWLEHGCLEDLQSAQANGLIPDFDVLILDEAQTLRQGWCAWLAAQFMGKPIIAFCDETQRFAFEKERISTNDLCNVFGIEGPFSLTIPLRSPRSVFDRLQRVRQPSYQMVNPRDVEEDTLQERVVGNVNTAIDALIGDLTAKGVNRADIVVLSRFGWSRNRISAERYETVARFRGMEAPVIIIAGADDMDDIELFCAYSRATTVCIALYEAEPLGCKSSHGKFQELVLEHPDNANIANAAREQGLTRFILARHIESASVGLSSVELSWCDTWKCWFVDREDDAEAADLWIDYLLAYHNWPVYSWTSSCRRKIKREDPSVNKVPGDLRTEIYELNVCEACTDITPHVPQLRQAPICQCCAGAIEERATPSQDVLAMLRKFDAIITSPNPGVIAQEVKNCLPLPLAALGARIYARARPLGVPVELNQLANSSTLHRLATAFIYSRISVKQVGTKFERDMLAKDTGRYVLPEGLTPEAWRQAIARCLGQSAKAGLLRKQKDGVFETVPIGNSASLEFDEV